MPASLSKVGLRRWIVFGFTEAEATADGRPLGWSEWADQFDEWWRNLI